MSASPTRTRRILRVIVTFVAATLLFFVSAIPAWSMTLTFVRHGESEANAAGIIDTSVPGPGLTELGHNEAKEVADALVGNDYDGIYSSNMRRAIQTARPLADMPEQPILVELPGLREINAGWFEGSSEHEGLGRIGYILPPVAWTLGLRLVPVLGGEDGNEFDARMDDAIRAIHDNGDENAVAFAHAATIMFWTLMNVDNPDLLLLLTHQLGNTETVVIEGSPDEGWTLVSWAGVDVAANPSLITKLFVHTRDLIVAPQTALYNIGQAFTSGDIAQIADAIRDGVVDVATTAIEFVPNVIRDVVDSVVGMAPATSDQPATAEREVLKVSDDTASTGFTGKTTPVLSTAPADTTRPSDATTLLAGQESADPAEPDERATTASAGAEQLATASPAEKTNGATDLTTGNKAVPGKFTDLADARARVRERLPDAVLESVEPGDPAENDRDAAPADAGADNDTGAAQQDAA